MSKKGNACCSFVYLFTVTDWREKWEERKTWMYFTTNRVNILHLVIAVYDSSALLSSRPSLQVIAAQCEQICYFVILCIYLATSNHRSTVEG